MLKEPIRGVQRMKIENALIENFISLQKVLTNLSLKMDEVGDKITKLLEVFEIAAKSMAEKNMDFGEDNKNIQRQLDSLIEQNKTMAKALAHLGDQRYSDVPRSEELY
jgi:ABC-type transporter Mla subunit MlaD